MGARDEVSEQLETDNFLTECCFLTIMARCLDCGKESDGKLCTDCKGRIYPAKRIKMQIETCRDCGVYKYLGVWKQWDKFISALRSKIKSKYNVDEVKEEETDRGVRFHGVHPETNDVIVDIRIMRVLCRKCERMRSSFYTTIVQLRNCDDKIKEFALNMLEKLKGMVTKVDDTKWGPDIYIGNKKAGLMVCQKLRSKYGGVIKESAKLFSFDRQKSKKIFRNTILFKKFPLPIGQEFMYKGETYLIADVAPMLIGVDSKNKRKKIKYEEIEKIGIF